MPENAVPYRKPPGRNTRLVRRASRTDIRAFVYAAMRWLQIAPNRFWDWNERPVELKVYSADGEVRWLSPTKEIRRLVADSQCPLEVLAVAAWDIIKSLPVHVYGSPLRRKAQHKQAIEKRDKAAKALAAGGTASDRSIRSFEHFLAKSYGYVDADDLSLPFYSERLSKLSEKVRRGDFGKTLAQRRKMLGKDSRTRWPRPPNYLLGMPSRMRTYWRKHASYETAYKTIAASSAVLAATIRALREVRDTAPETHHGALTTALLIHEGFASGD
jgi:hypothetical protein